MGVSAAALALALTSGAAARQPDSRAQPFVYDSRDDGQKRVLVIHQLRPDSPLSASMEDVYRAVFRRELGTHLDYYSEFMDTLRFAQPDYQAAFATYLRVRYAGYHFDVIITPTTAALNFVRDTLGDVFAGVPVVFGSGIGVERPPHSTGVASVLAFGDTLDLALRLQPDVRHVFIVSGTADIDRAYAAAVQSQLQRFDGRVSLTSLAGLPMKDLEQRLAHLPPESAVYYVAISRDGAAERLLPVEVVDRLVAVANAPIYGWHQLMLGHGIVGGQLFDSTIVARETAEMALRVLRGESVDSIPIRELSPYVLQVDWRQLARWHFDASRLPAGVAVLYRPQTRWERARPYAMVTLAVLAVVGALAVALSFERRRRRQAEARTRHYLTTVAQLDRRAVMGRLTATLAHELRQPLSAILLNSQAARIMLESDAPLRIEDLLEIVDDIRKDDERAAGIIARVRAMLHQHAQDVGPVDVVELARETVTLLASDAARRETRVRLDAPESALFTIGDRVHLQQALLNLLLNALDAMADTPPDDRDLSVVVAPAGATIDVAVRDRGAGFTLDEARLFEPFFTTKPDGMGMGLFIARGIVDAHGGRLSAVSHAPHGSTFRIELPRHAAVPAERLIGSDRASV
jgi:signal transduction histidine kinase